MHWYTYTMLRIHIILLTKQISETCEILRLQWLRWLLASSKSVDIFKDTNARWWRLKHNALLHVIRAHFHSMTAFICLDYLVLITKDKTGHPYLANLFRSYLTKKRETGLRHYNDSHHSLWNRYLTWEILSSFAWVYNLRRKLGH